MDAHHRSHWYISSLESTESVIFFEYKVLGKVILVSFLLVFFYQQTKMDIKHAFHHFYFEKQ